MSVVTCKYHTKIPARWTCHQCRINYCPSCVKPVRAGDTPSCPVCKQELDSAGTGNMIKPFWLRLGQFFLFPMHPGPLMLILVFSLLTFLLYLTPIAFILMIPLGFMFLKYCHVVLEDTAHGHITPRPISMETLAGDIVMPFKLIGLVIAYQLLIFGALDLFDRPGYYLASIFASLALPASIAVLSIEHSFINAFNPVLILTTIQRIGLPYFIMFALLYFLQVAQSSILGFLAGIVEPPLSFIVFYFILMYFLIIVFNMLGYILYQYHEELGFEIDVEAHEHEENVAADPVTVSPELRTVEILIQEGKTDEAVTQLQNVARNSPSDLEARNRLLKLLRLTGDMARHRSQGQDYISYLFHENKTGQAADIYQECYEYDKTFRPAKAVERLELARFLRQNARHRLVLAVLNNLHVDFPTYDGVPQAYLIVAQLLCEQFNEDEKARKVLEFVITNYPTSPAIVEVKEYQGIVKGLSPS